MLIQLKSIHRILSASRRLHLHLPRFCSSQVQLNDAKPEREVVRVRCALTSSESLQLSGLRLALYNFLFANANKGQLIVRIENADKSTSNQSNQQSIFDGLQWAGITPAESCAHGGDHGPYETSQRLDIYRKNAEQLVAKNGAYYCFCSKEDLEAQEKTALKTKNMAKYDNRCRHLTSDEVEEKLANNEPSQLRLKVEPETFSQITDIIRGPMAIGGCRDGDPILIDADGLPTNFFSSVVDDYSMRITHVMRGAEHLPNTPMDLALYHALGWQPPHFAHIPAKLKLGKMEKFSQVKYFRSRKYFPLAVLSYLTSCGTGFAWDANELRKIHTIEQLTKTFELKKLNKSTSVLKAEVLDECNRFELLRHLDDSQLRSGVVEQLIELVQQTHSEHTGEMDMNPAHIENVLNWCRSTDQIVSLNQLTDMKYAFLWTLPDIQSEQYGWIKPLTEQLQTTPKFDKNSLVGLIRNFSNSQHLKYSDFIGLLKKLLDHNNKGPGAVDIMAILGRETTVQRLSRHVNQ